MLIRVYTVLLESDVDWFCELVTCSFSEAQVTIAIGLLLSLLNHLSGSELLGIWKGAPEPFSPWTRRYSWVNEMKPQSMLSASSLLSS